jgi:hypothetical protein
MKLKELHKQFLFCILLPKNQGVKFASLAGSAEMG